MFYNNYGDLEIKNEYADELYSVLYKTLCGELKLFENCYPEKETSSIQISNCEGDISDDLEDILKYFADKGTSINGLIHYSGDYDGVYVIRNNEFECYDEKEWIFKNAFNGNSISKSLKRKLLEEIGNITSLIQLEKIVEIINDAEEF